MTQDWSDFLFQPAAACRGGSQVWVLTEEVSNSQATLKNAFHLLLLNLCGKTVGSEQPPFPAIISPRLSKWKAS